MPDFQLPRPSFLRPDATDMTPPDIKGAIAAGLEAREILRKSGYRIPEEARKGIILVDGLVAFLSKSRGGLYISNSGASLQKWCDDFWADILFIGEVYSLNDLHGANHIGTAIPWLMDDKQPIGNPFYVVDRDLVDAGRLVFVPDPAWGPYYTRKHEANGYGPVILYPPHAVEGTGEELFMPSIIELMTYWVTIHGTRWRNDRKGYYDKSEQLGGIRPNVILPGVPDGGVNVDLLRLIGRSDAPRYEAGGWAANFCLMATVRQIFDEYEWNPEIPRKFTLRTDWTTMIPGVNEESYDEFLHDIRKAGVTII